MSDSNSQSSPCGVGLKDSGIFGLDSSIEKSEFVLIPIAWDATTSYMAGTHKGPQSILESSPQLDLYHPDFPDLWKKGIYMPQQESWVAKENEITRKRVEDIIAQLESGKELTAVQQEQLAKVNQSSAKLTNWLESESKRYIEQGKIVGVVGGDHSVPLGLMQALANTQGEFGILHIDAHHDYRNAFMGFEESHASIMHNAAKIPEITRFVQVGIRDYCDEEKLFTETDPSRFITFYDQQLKESGFKGKTWHEQCQEIVSNLRENIYISFDIDGLAPHLCPSTGTPVPGGLGYEEVLYLIKLVSKKCKIIGFDLVEVGGETDSIDAIVGARILWHLCGYTSSSK